MALFFVLLASICASFGNYTLRKNLDNGGSSTAYLVIYFSFSLLVASVINPVFSQLTHFHTPMFSLGVFVGLLMALMMLFTTISLSKGPSSLTFAFQNSSAVVPTLMLAAIFGSVYGFNATPSLIIGAICVIAGLFWAAVKQKGSESTKPSWYFFACMMFLVQAFTLTLFQWKCLLTQNVAEHSLIPFSCSLEDEIWFMPGLFISATLLQTMYFVCQEKRMLKFKEIQWGLIGGIANGISTYLLLQANMLATSMEKGVIFPLFAVSVILICNAWGQWLYREKVYWPANILCSTGILISAVDIFLTAI